MYEEIIAHIQCTYTYLHIYIDHFHSESICDFKMHVIAKNKKSLK